MNEPLQLVPNRPDKEVAEEIKQKVKEAYEGLLPVLDEAASKGFMVQAGVAMGPFGKFVIQQLTVIKQF